MDVDIIFKRGLAYTAASGGVVARIHFALVALIARAVPRTGLTARCGGIIAIVDRRVSVPAASATGFRRVWTASSTGTASTIAAR